MQNNHNKKTASPVSTVVSDKTKLWLENLETKYGIGVGKQLYYVLAEIIQSEKDLEKLVVKGLLNEHESKGKLLQDMANELGLNSNSKPVISANVVDVFTKKTKPINKTIKKVLETNSDVNTKMKSAMQDCVSKNQSNEFEIDWTSLGKYRYSDLDILGMSMKDYSVLKEDNLFCGFKSGMFATLHNQALALWRDEEKQPTIKEIVRLQPRYTKTGELRNLCIQSIAKRLFKAIVHFGTAEEKQLLFGTSEIYPKPRKKKA